MSFCDIHCVFSVEKNDDRETVLDSLALLVSGPTLSSGPSGYVVISYQLTQVILNDNASVTYKFNTCNYTGQKFSGVDKGSFFLTSPYVYFMANIYVQGARCIARISAFSYNSAAKAEEKIDLEKLRTKT